MSEDANIVTEVVGPGVSNTDSEWQTKVWERTGNRCYNCGSTHKVRVDMIIPEVAGGKKIPSNAFLVCRACEIASDTSSVKTRHADNRPINFWVSRRLFDRMNNGLCEDRGFKSKSALIRYLMGKFISAEDQFDDLSSYQDPLEGADVVKINAWVPKDTYSVFQEITRRKGTTVTEAIKSLVMVYEEEAFKGNKNV